MKTPLSDLFFPLPEELIALTPSANRDDCRLLAVNRSSGDLSDTFFFHLPNFLKPGDLLVFNDVRVDKSRIYGKKASGSLHEVLLIQSSSDLKKWSAVAKKTRKLKKGDQLFFPGQISAFLTDDPQNGKISLLFSEPLTETLLDLIGEIPLPPYIRGKRNHEKSDEIFYQTVFAKEGGAKAAPTAGLHFSENLLNQLGEAGIQSARVRLFVSLGTFEPIKSEYVEDHEIHEEEYLIEDSQAQLINQAIKEKRRIIAVGTTVVRTLESAFHENGVIPGRQKTRIFITPGYEFKVINALITNFHTPYSTLLMLVSAFMGKDLLEKTYSHAIKEKYRFFSYGDAMLIF